MGNEAAKASVVLPSNFGYFGIQFAHDNELRLVGAPADVLQAANAVLTAFWKVANIEQFDSFVQISLDGSPWYHDELQVKYFICALLKQFYALGWHLKTATDLQHEDNSSSVLIFERLAPVMNHVMCLNLSGSDAIRVLAPDSLTALIRTAIVTHWPQGIQEEHSFKESHIFKLKGTPWDAETGKGSYFSTLLISALMQLLYQQGWVFIAGIDCSKREQHINSLYFRFDPQETNRPENFNSKFIVLSLNESDKIRLYNAPNELVLKVQAALPEIWKQGIQEEENKHNAYVFKLKGNPWISYLDETVDSRKLMSGLFSLFHGLDWTLYGTCTVSTSIASKSTLFFRQPGAGLASRPIVDASCVSLNSDDKIRMISFSQDVIYRAREAIKQGWPYGIQDEREYYTAWQFTLNSSPFSCSDGNSKSIHACLTMMLLMATLESNGQRFHCSLDLSAKFESKKEFSGRKFYSEDLHSWFFIRQR